MSSTVRCGRTSSRFCFCTLLPTTYRRFDSQHCRTRSAHVHVEEVYNSQIALICPDHWRRKAILVRWWQRERLRISSKRACGESSENASTPSGGPVALAFTYTVACDEGDPGPTLTRSVWVMRWPVFWRRMSLARRNTRSTSAGEGTRDALSSTATRNASPAGTAGPGFVGVVGAGDGLLLPPHAVATTSRSAAPISRAVIALSVTSIWRHVILLRCAERHTAPGSIASPLGTPSSTAAAVVSASCIWKGPRPG